MEGIIVSIKYGMYSVESDGVIYNTSPRGLLKYRGKLYVGDKVIMDDENYIINDVLERKSLLKRPPISNIDQILLIFSLK